MLLSESEVEALVMLVTGLWITCVLLFLGLLRLQRRFEMDQAWSAQGFKELGERVVWLEGELKGMFERTGLMPLQQSEEAGKAAAVSAGVRGDAAQ